MNRTTTLLAILASTTLAAPVAWAQWGSAGSAGANSSPQAAPSYDRDGPNSRSRADRDSGDNDNEFSRGDRGSSSRDSYGPRQSPGTLWFTQSYPAGAQPIQKGSPGGAGLWEIGFNGASSALNVRPGDELFCWVQLNGSSVPREILLSFNDGSSWEHRAYWGQDQITYGKDNTPSRLNAGALPSTDGWVKLTVPASSVALSGQVTGMTVSLQGGQAQFGAVGVEPQGTGQYGYGPAGQPGGGAGAVSRNGNDQGSRSDRYDSNRNYGRDYRDSTFPGDSPRDDRNSRQPASNDDRSPDDR